MMSSMCMLGSQLSLYWMDGEETGAAMRSYAGSDPCKSYPSHPILCPLRECEESEVTSPNI